MIFCGVFYLSANERKSSGEVVTEQFSDEKSSESMDSNETAGDGTPAKEQESKKQNITETHIYIHICGAVKKPGVYTFDKEPRVIEVVEKAGGFTGKADQTSINLAEIVSDGTKLEIVTKGKKENQSNLKKAASGSSDGKVNINTAAKEELMTINGIGESKASQIISYRETNGGFQKIEDIMNISGIKEGIFSKIKDMITVSE